MNHNPLLPPPYGLAQSIERLPVGARRKYEELAALVADAAALQRTLMERVAAQEEKLAAVGRRRQYSLHGGEHDEAARLDGELAALVADLERLERERGRRNALRANTEQVVSRLNSFITGLFSGFEVAAPSPVPDDIPGRDEGESLPDALARVRCEIASAQGELAIVRAAPLPAREVKAAIATEVDRLAREGMPRLWVEGGKVELRMPDQQLFGLPGQALSAPSGSASRLLAWLHRDEIVAELTAGVADAPGAIPATERPARVRALEARVHGLEVAEERLVMAALEAGLDVQRRPEASAWAILYTTAEDGLAEAPE